MRDWRLPVLVVAGLVLARLSGGQLPFFIFYLSLILFAASWFWTRHALWRTECLIQIEKDRVEVGESLGVRVRIDNDTFLPLPWAEVDDATPQHMVVTDMPRQATSVPLLGSRVITFRLTALRRGHYPVGPIRVTLGDPFGLFRGAREFRSKSAITIYPRIYPLEGLQIPLSQPFGHVRTRERAFEDPSNQAELRQYRPGDNPKHIHWKTSARMGELMLRQYEINATTPMIIFPDLSRDAQAGRPVAGEPSTAETVIEVAASLAAYGARRNLDVGLVCHGEARRAVNAGRGQRTFREIMEVLARVEANGRLTMEQVLELETAHLSGKSTLVIVTPRLSAGLADLLVRLRSRHQVMLVLLRKETFGHALREPEAQVAAPAQGEGPYLLSLTSLLLSRQVAIYLVSAQDDLRRLADLRLTAGPEGVRPWSQGARLSPTRA